MLQIIEDLSEYLSLIHNKFNIYLLGHSLLKENALSKIKNANIQIKRVDVKRTCN